MMLMIDMMMMITMMVMISMMIILMMMIDGDDGMTTDKTTIQYRVLTCCITVLLDVKLPLKECPSIESPMLILPSK